MRLTMTKIVQTSTVRLAALAIGAAVTGAVPAHAEIVGTLACNVAPGAGAIIGSQRAVACTYRSSLGPVELYSGTISRLGIDVGNQQSGVIAYNVNETGVPVAGALAGNYFGPGFGLTLGSGGGVNALIGGNGSAIALQPLLATSSTGVNFNAGVGNLHLDYIGPEQPPRMRRARRHLRHA